MITISVKTSKCLQVTTNIGQDWGDHTHAEFLFNNPFSALTPGQASPQKYTLKLISDSILWWPTNVNLRPKAGHTTLHLEKLNRS